MKTTGQLSFFSGFLRSSLLLAAALSSSSQQQLSAAGQIINAFSTSWTDAAGRPSYIEIGAGLNWQDDQGVWRRSEAKFIETDEGFAAPFAHHKVELSKNLNEGGAVKYRIGETQGDLLRQFEFLLRRVYLPL